MCKEIPCTFRYFAYKTSMLRGVKSPGGSDQSGSDLVQQPLLHSGQSAAVSTCWGGAVASLQGCGWYGLHQMRVSAGDDTMPEPLFGNLLPLSEPSHLVHLLSCFCCLPVRTQSDCTWTETKIIQPSAGSRGGPIALKAIQ